MPIFEHETHLPFARDDVFDWYSRPGALTRLHPPFAGKVIREPTQGLADGSESTLAINLPGLLGTSLTAMADLVGSATSIPLRSWISWTSRHTDFRAGRGFTDEMISGPASSWRHERQFDDDGAGTVLHEKVTYQLPLAGRLPGVVRDRIHRQFEAELRRIFDHRARQTSEDLAFQQGHRRLASQLQDAERDGDASPVRVVAVSGSSGMIGTQVCALLGGAGLEVRRLVRRPPQETDAQQGEIAWDPQAGHLDEESLRDVDVVIHLAGHPLAARFTEEHKEKVLSSRVDGTDLVARTLARLEQHDSRGRALISGSAIGWYGAQLQDRPHEEPVLTEDLPAGTDFLAETCQAWESATAPAAEAGVRVAMIRTGIVQSPLGGVLEQLVPLFAVGAGGPLGDQQEQSWISIDDIASLIVHLALDPRAEGPVNGVAPEPVTARQYAKTLAAVMRRPSAIPVPSFGPKLMLGQQGAQEIAMADQHVSAEKAASLGFAFRHPRLTDALHHLLGR